METNSIQIKKETQHENTKMTSIPDLTVKIIDNLLANSYENSSTIFFIGSKQVGKSTLISNFLDKHDVPRETLMLEYSFGRKTVQKQELEKNVCHVWEYGGALHMANEVILSVPLKNKCTFCLMIDLSKVRKIWNTIEMCFKELEKIRAKHPDLQNTEQLEIVIIGGKYDLFENNDGETRKIICTALRSLAMIYQCHLLFYSLKDHTLTRRTKEVLYNIGFGNGIAVKEKVKNPNKPIFVPKGTDSWENIGLKPSTVDQVKSRYLSHIPLETEIDTSNRPNSGPAVRTTVHAEPVLDALISNKYEEIKNKTPFTVK